MVTLHEGRACVQPFISSLLYVVIGLLIFPFFKFDGSIEPWYEYRVSDSHSSLTRINLLSLITQIL